MKKILWVFCLLLIVGQASANVVLTEVMHSPTQTESDTDGEWVEIYNNGDETVDLENWTIDGYNIDDAVIGPGEYMVVARELVDGTDTDNESFESVWGNGDGVWDANDGFLAIDGYFSLSDDDTIILSDGDGYEETLSFNSSFGGMANGKSIERIDYFESNVFSNWVESEDIGGTPGHGKEEAAEAGGDEVIVNAIVNNILPNITFAAILTDDSPDSGVQVMPNPLGEKLVAIKVEVQDMNGADDVVSVEVIVANRTYQLERAADNYSTANFNGTFNMLSQDIAGLYDAGIVASDSTGSVVAYASFEYMGMISAVLETSYIQFSGLNPGDVSPAEQIVITNTGNTQISSDVSGADLVSGENELSAGSLELEVEGQWEKLSASPLVVGNLIEPAKSSSLNIRMSVPENTKPGDYSTALRIVSRAV